MSIPFVLMLLAMVCFIITALGYGLRRVNLLPLGLFFWVLADIIRLVT